MTSCFLPIRLPHTVEVSHSSFSLLEHQAESCDFQFLFGLSRLGIKSNSTVAVSPNERLFYAELLMIYVAFKQMFFAGREFIHFSILAINSREMESFFSLTVLLTLELPTLRCLCLPTKAKCVQLKETIPSPSPL